MRLSLSGAPKLGDEKPPTTTQRCQFFWAILTLFFSLRNIDSLASTGWNQLYFSVGWGLQPGWELLAGKKVLMDLFMLQKEVVD